MNITWLALYHGQYHPRCPVSSLDLTGARGLIQALIQSQPCDNLCITKLVCDWLKVFGTVLQGGL